jgi:hypothetical protein
MATQLPIDPFRRLQLRGAPRTGRGKASSTRTLLKHGLTVKDVITFDESADEFEQFYLELAAALDAKDGVEELLVERAILCAWRLRRDVYRIETGLFSRARTSWHNGAARVTRDIDLVYLRLASHDDELAKRTQYEANLKRSLLQTLREIDRCKRHKRPRSDIAPLLLSYAGRGQKR